MKTKLDLRTRISVKQLSLRLKFVDLIISFAQISCPHILLRVHTDDDGHIYEICAFCYKEIDAEVEDE